MEEGSVKLKRFLIIFAVGVLIIKSMTGAGFFEAKSHKGKGYYVKIPVGWKIVKKQKGAVYPEGVEIATFVPKETDPAKEKIETYISIFTQKLTSPIWIEDEFPDILKSIRKSGHKIMDKGEVKLDGVISEWVVYHDKKIPALVLDFYMVTDNSVFFKIQYSVHPNKFNKLRGSFEELKESFKFRFSLF